MSPVDTEAEPGARKRPPPDPRVYFAAERTLLAWVRTAIGVIGLGFVVARFGLFLRMMRAGAMGAAPEGPHLPTAVLGVALCVLGSALAATSAWQHRRFVARLGADELPRDYLTGIGPLFGLGVAAAGLLLATELLF